MSVASLASLPHQPWGNDRDPLGQQASPLQGPQLDGGNAGIHRGRLCFCFGAEGVAVAGKFLEGFRDGFWGEIQL